MSVKRVLKYVIYIENQVVRAQMAKRSLGHGLDKEHLIAASTVIMKHHKHQKQSIWCFCNTNQQWFSNQAHIHTHSDSR